MVRVSLLSVYGLPASYHIHEKAYRNKFRYNGDETMNEMQNENGTWSKAEPTKASWETNRLLQLFKKFKRMFS